MAGISAHDDHRPAAAVDSRETGVTADASCLAPAMIVDSHPVSRALARIRDGRGGHAGRVTGGGAHNPLKMGGKGTQPPYRPQTAAANGACEAGEDCPAADRRYRPRNMPRFRIARVTV